jgi:hypothetical protein
MEIEKAMYRVHRFFIVQKARYANGNSKTPRRQTAEIHLQGTDSGAY